MKFQPRNRLTLPLSNKLYVDKHDHLILLDLYGGSLKMNLACLLPTVLI